MTTISISLIKEITERVKPPRSVFPGFPLGHPVGYPFQSFRQLQILRLLLKQLKTIKIPGTIIEYNLTSDGDSKESCILCDLDMIK